MRIWPSLTWKPRLQLSLQDMTMELSDTLRALRSLAPHHRNSVVLVGVGGLSYENAAKLCGTPIGTMKSRVRRGREALLSALAVPKASFENGPRAIDAADDLMAKLASLVYPEAHVGGHARRDFESDEENCGFSIWNLETHPTQPAAATFDPVWLVVCDRNHVRDCPGFSIGSTGDIVG